MKNQINYNVFAAIDFRSTTAVLLTDSFGNPEPIDFKLSITLAKDDQFMFGYGYEPIYQLGFNGRRDVTKEEYKAKYSSFRKYYYDLSQEPEYNLEDTCPNA